MYLSRSLSLDARRILSALAVALLCLSGGRYSCAQSIQGSIIGTIQDKAGAVVPGATLTLKNLDEGSTRTTTSNTSGDYQFLDLVPARYDIEVTAPGFESWKISGAQLTARQQLRVDAALSVGAVQQTVQISGDNASANATAAHARGAARAGADHTG